MPIFDFKCNYCEHIFEKLILGSQTVPKDDCPECGKSDCWTKIISVRTSKIGDIDQEARELGELTSGRGWH